MVIETKSKQKIIGRVKIYIYYKIKISILQLVFTRNYKSEQLKMYKSISSKEVQVNTGRDRFTEIGKELKFMDGKKYPVVQFIPQNIVDNQRRITSRKRTTWPIQEERRENEEGTQTRRIKTLTKSTQIAIEKKIFLQFAAMEQGKRVIPSKETYLQNFSIYKPLPNELKVYDSNGNLKFVKNRKE